MPREALRFPACCASGYQSQPGGPIRWSVSIKHELLGHVSQLLFEDLCAGGQFAPPHTGTLHKHAHACGPQSQV